MKNPPTLTEETLVIPSWPRILPRAHEYTLSVNGAAVPVLSCSVGRHATFEFRGRVEVAIETPQPVTEVTIRPKSRGIAWRAEGNVVRFALERPENLMIELDRLPHLFLFAFAPDAHRPDPAAPGVRYFAAGQVYETGEIALGAGETLYVEAGAVVRGCVVAEASAGVTIAGRGILDGSYYRRGTEEGPRRTILAHQCRDLTVRDVLIVEPSAWTCHLVACEDARIEGLRILAELSGSDGIDLAGCSRVAVEGCFIRSYDDCVAVKALDLKVAGREVRGSCNSEDIAVRRCALYCDGGGSAMEIGHELRGDFVRNVLWEDIDVMGEHLYGSVFSIRNGEHATVENVTYRDIRVEHYYNELVGFRIMRSRYSREEERGHVRNVVLENVRVEESPYNAGYSLSHIGGWDDAHAFETVVFRDFWHGERQVLCADDIDLYVKYARDVRFE
jgi:hypothetical protein